MTTKPHLSQDQMEEGEQVDCVSDEEESEYWARRMGRRVWSQVVPEPDPCLFPATESEEMVYWFRPDQAGAHTYTRLHTLSCRWLTFLLAWRQRRDGDSDRDEPTGRQLTALGLHKCLGGDRVVMELERDIVRLQAYTGQRLGEEDERFLASNSEERIMVGGCYKSLAIIFRSVRSQFFINADVVRERLLSENENYYQKLYSELSPSIGEFHVTVDQLLKI